MQLTDKGLPTVIVSANLNLKGGRSGCRGFLDYARAHGPWRCLMLSEGRAGEQLLTLKRLGVSGISAQNLSRRDAALVAAMNVPVVLREPPPEMLAPGEPLAGAPYVKVDSYAVGVLAANYYLARGYHSFAYVVQAAGCSRRYVEQHFRSQLSASVRDIILRTKLERVRSLLEESNLSIGEIAAQCGNMNESHLAVLFKKATGLSMSDYRRQNREPPDD